MCSSSDRPLGHQSNPNSEPLDPIQHSSSSWGGTSRSISPADSCPPGMSGAPMDISRPGDPVTSRRPGVLPLQPRAEFQPFSFSSSTDFDSVSPGISPSSSMARYAIPSALSPAQRSASCASPEQQHSRLRPSRSPSERLSPISPSLVYKTEDSESPKARHYTHSTLDTRSSPSVTLHPVLESFFYRSSQAIFGVLAKPIYNALCRRCTVGKSEDPEELGSLPRNPFTASDEASPVQNLAYPHISGQEADAGRDFSLSDLLKPTYVNPVAEDLACQALNIDRSDPLYQALQSWDIMKLLGHKQLSRWLAWLRDIMERTPSAVSAFRTPLKTQGHHLAAQPSAHQKQSIKKHGIDSPVPCHTSSDLSHAPPEIVMTATLVECSGSSLHMDDWSYKEITDDYMIIFSAVITQQISGSYQSTGEHTATSNPDLRPPPMSRYASDNSANHSGTSNSTARNSESSSPKRIKTSGAPLAMPKYADPSAPTVDLVYRMSSNDASQELWTSQGWSGQGWMGETEARRVIHRATKRRANHSSLGSLLGTSSTIQIPQNNARRARTPSHSSLSIETHVELEQPSPHIQPVPSTLDMMVIDQGPPETLDRASIHQIAHESRIPTFDSTSQPIKLDGIQSGSSFASCAQELASQTAYTPEEEQTVSMDVERLGTIRSRPYRTDTSDFPSPWEQTMTGFQRRYSRSLAQSSSSSLGTAAARDSGVAAFRQSLLISPMGRLIADHNWQDTPIGPMEHWSSTLRSMVCLILSSPYRMSLLWGEDCVMLYNDAYVKTAGRKHPGLLGQSGAHGWAELWADLGEIANSVLNGDVYTVYDSLLFFDRDPDNVSGIRKEECYHSFSWIPVRGPTGQVEGILNPSFETTSRVIAERRLGTLRDMIQISLVSRSRDSYKAGCFECISKNPYDLPFAIIYTCETIKASPKDGNCGDDAVLEHKNRRGTIDLKLTLAGSVAVPVGHPSAPEHLEFSIQTMGSGTQYTTSSSSASTLGNPCFGSSSASSGTSQKTSTTEFADDRHAIWPLQEACTLQKPIYIADLENRAKGFELKGWMDEPTSAVVMPVSTSEDTPPLAVIVFGLSPRLYWTEAYALFLNLLTRQFSTGLSTVISHEEEAKRIEELAALDRAKTAFFTNISHELRTPLTLIVGPISDILESHREISPAARERLKIVERNTQRIINLVNQLLDLSRFEAGKMVARFRSIDLSKLAANVAALFRSAMLKNQIELVVDCSETLKRVWVDQDFMEKVLFNLLSNSLKFTPRGGQVLIQVYFDTNKCYMICSDTGVGIKKEDLPRIFERFHRVEDSSRKAEGTGIGLALVQDIVKLHHGHLEVESEIDRGSKFTITLPLGLAHLPADSIDYTNESQDDKITDRVIASNARRWMLGDPEPLHSALMSEAATASDVSSSHGSTESAHTTHTPDGFLSTIGSTVLIADDNSDMRNFLKSILSRYYKVAEASDGLEAYNWAKAHRPDLVLTDVMMPIMDGFQLLRKLKSESDTATISVILLSARGGSEIRVEGLAEGADDYLVKPFEPKELVARINNHLQLSKMRQRLENAVATRTELLRQNEQKYRDLYHTFEAISMLSPVGIVQLDFNGNITFANKSFHSQCKLPANKPLAAWIGQIHPDDLERMRRELSNVYETHHAAKGEFRWFDESWCLYELSPYFLDCEEFAGYLGSTTDVTERKESERRQLEAAESRARDAEESKRQQEAFIDMTSHEIRNPLHGIHQAADLLINSLRTLHKYAQKRDEIFGPDLEYLIGELGEDIDAVESIQLCASHQSRIADDIINVSKLSMGLLTTVKTDFDLIARVREVLTMYLIEAQQKGVTLELEIGQGLGENPYICADPNRLAQVTINFLSNALRYTSNSSGRRQVTVRVNLFTSCPEPHPHGRRIGHLRPEIAEAFENLVYAEVGVQDTARGLSHDELSKLFARFAQANPTQDQYGGSGLGLYVSHRLIENHGGFIEVVSTKGEGSVFSFVIPVKRGRKKSEEMGGTNDTRDGPTDMKEDDIVEMQPATALMPMGSIPRSCGKSSRDPSPVLNSTPRSSIAPVSPDHSSSIQYVTSTSAIPPAPSSEKTHVLVVEDNLINVKVIKRQLTLKGYTVSVAMDGRQALNRIYADASQTSDFPPIDIVLMDIQMPVMDGLAAITELRAAEKAGEIKRRYPVIAITGNARREQTEQCLASGFDNICVKPYKIDEVQQHMEALLAACKLGDN